MGGDGTIFVADGVFGEVAQHALERGHGHGHHRCGVVEVPRGQHGMDVGDQDGSAVTTSAAVVRDPRQHGVVVHEDPVELDPGAALEHAGHGDHGFPHHMRLGDPGGDAGSLGVGHADGDSVGRHAVDEHVGVGHRHRPHVMGMPDAESGHVRGHGLDDAAQPARSGVPDGRRA